MEGRIMALDVGAKRTGVAISDETRAFGFPHSVFEASNKKEWVAKVLGLLKEEEGITTILVGLPLNQHGEAGEDAENIRQFIALLQQRITLPVIEWDERFTTIQAERTLLEADISRKNRKQVVDKLAASIILQTYLDSLQFRETPAWEHE